MCASPTRPSIVDFRVARCVGRVLSVVLARVRNVSSNGEAALVARLRADLYALVAVDVVAMPDATLRSELVELLAAANQLNAAIASRIASFDTRAWPTTTGARPRRCGFAATAGPPTPPRPGWSIRPDCCATCPRWPRPPAGVRSPP